MLKGMVETTEEWPPNEDDEDENECEEDKIQTRPIAVKEFIFATKPDLFEHLIGLSDDQSESADEDASLVPLIERLLVLSFREDLDDDPVSRAWGSVARYPIAELFYPDLEAQASHEAMSKAFAAKIKSFNVLTPELKADEMDEDLRNEQRALINGLHNSTPIQTSSGQVPLSFLEAPCYAADNGIEDLEEAVGYSRKYVPFFLSAIVPSASESILNAVGEALAVGLIDLADSYAMEYLLPNKSRRLSS
ncbi:ARM domain-containing protein [Rhizoctonia solani]|uniref:ARM domain-containing protein n=1 Tax=Rhizoctonia solani TaxID=456999 RepID=A0A8H8NS08_9AGAM|nr:ARM domain-containing protein [Rhizoctonia solani]QRW18844.1 ARM domain-containing protein [Rhizoctonia solani]